MLLISNGFPPCHWAGTETYTAGIAQSLHQRGYQIQVLCGGNWQQGVDSYNGYRDQLYKDIPVRRLNLNWMKAPDPFLYLYNNPVVAACLAGYLEEFQPDLVHVTSCEKLSASVLQVVKEAGLPLVLSLTDFWFLCPRINLLRSDGDICDGRTTAWDCLACQLRHSKAYRWSRRILSENNTARLLTGISQYPRLTRQRGLRGLAGDMTARNAFLSKALHWPDYRITASHFVRHLFVANGISAPIHVQPYGHDLSWLDDYRGKSPSDIMRIGFIGQLTESKGAHLLLEAAGILRQAVGDTFRLSIYGDLEKDPAYSADLRRLARTLVQDPFRGTYAHDQSAGIFADVDVLVVPSLWYDFPLVIYQAFATRTPVIATNLGGMAEAVTHAINGLLFKRGDAADLARQLRHLIDKPELLQHLQARTPRVKTVEEETEQLVGIYKNLLAPVPPSSDAP